MYQLPTFKGYTIDLRLREFRLAVPGEQLEFVSFDSPEGVELLRQFKDFAYQVIEIFLALAEAETKPGFKADGEE